MVKYRKILQSPNLPRYPCKISQKGQQTNNKALNQQITINLTRFKQQ